MEDRFKSPTPCGEDKSSARWASSEPMFRLRPESGLKPRIFSTEPLKNIKNYSFAVAGFHSFIIAHIDNWALQVSVVWYCRFWTIAYGS